MPTIIRYLGDEQIHTAKDINEFCIKTFQFSDADLQERLHSGQTTVVNRIGWARTYLKKAGLIKSPQRAMYQLTEKGKDVFKKGSDQVTLNYLQQFTSFNTFFNGEHKQEPINEFMSNDEYSQMSPQEMMDCAVKQINDSVSDELMTEIMKISSYDFERLVALLLIKMGYGELRLNDSAVTKKSGDEGIDGIVIADKFGFDSIYIQAKQWNPDSVVGRPEIQKFLGALAGQGAGKGLFITTARFSAGAVQYVQKQLSVKIILVDGVQLAKLMIEYSLGVSTVATYEMKRLDYDFFHEDI